MNGVLSHTLSFPILLDHPLPALDVAQVVANQPKALLGIRSGSVRISLGTFGTARYRFLLEMVQIRVPVRDDEADKFIVR